MYLFLIRPHSLTLLIGIYIYNLYKTKEILFYRDIALNFWLFLYNHSNTGGGGGAENIELRHLHAQKWRIK